MVEKYRNSNNKKNNLGKIFLQQSINPYGNKPYSSVQILTSIPLFQKELFINYMTTFCSNLYRTNNILPSYPLLLVVFHNFLIIFNPILIENLFFSMITSHPPP